jgi:hypothetical protein
MPQLKAAKQAPSEELVSISDMAERWEVTPKTIGKWAQIVYLAFDVNLPTSGPFIPLAVQLIDLVAKHISKKSSFYHTETQESRRLEASEFIRKIRHLRQEGHFQEFAPLKVEPDEDQDDELDTLAELAEIAKTQDRQLSEAQQTFEAREDEQIEKLVTFMEQTDQRRMGKLAKRLKQRQLSGTPTDQAIDVGFKRLN